MPATSYTLTGPNTGPVNQPSPAFTVTPNGTFTGTINLSANIAGTFSPTSLVFSGTSAAQTFTFTPTVAGTATISTTNTGTLTNPSPLTYIAVAVPVSYITSVGSEDIAAASPTGPLINITSFKIGSDNIFADSATTLKGLTGVQSGGVNGSVYTMASSSQLTYSVLSPNEVAYIVTLDETVGNFTIGNIGLYSSDGTLFSITALSATTSKVQTSGTVLGNRKIYEILVNFTNAATLSNLTVLTEYAYNLATVPTELLLPSPISPPYNVYLIQQHTLLGVQCLATNYNSIWEFYTATQTEAQNPGAIALPPNSFAGNVNPGDAVYFDSSTSKFRLAVAPTSSFSKYPIAIAGYGNCIYPNGSVFFNALGSYTPGTMYYCNDSGSTGNVKSSGVVDVLTAPVGIAISSNALLVQVSNTNGQLIGTGPQDFPSNGTYNSSAGVKFIIVESLGAGGGTGGLAVTGSTGNAVTGGGQAGSYAKAIFLTGFTGGLPVLIGGGGNAGIGSNPGSYGGTTSFGNVSSGAYISCPGGAGSIAGRSYSTSGSGPIIIPGASDPTLPTIQNYAQILKITSGQPGGDGFSTNNIKGGQGGGSEFGWTPLGGTSSNAGVTNAGVNATVPGAGGSAPSSNTGCSAATGATGGPGFVRVWEYS